MSLSNEDYNNMQVLAHYLAIVHIGDTDKLGEVARRLYAITKNYEYHAERLKDMGFEPND